ncbi:MAG: hypothetical protein SGARI_001538 [Bacillariaceae sp.]
MLQEVKAFMQAKPGFPRMDILVNGVERQLTIASFRFQRDIYFCAQYHDAKNGTLIVVPVCPEGDEFLTDRIVVLIIENGPNDTLTLKKNIYTRVCKSCYFFKDKGRYSRLYPRALEEAKRQAQLRNVSATISALTTTVSNTADVAATNQRELRNVSTGMATLMTNMNDMANVVTSQQAQAVANRDEAMSMFREAGNTFVTMAKNQELTIKRLDGHDNQFEIVGEKLVDHEARLTVQESANKERNDIVAALTQRMTTIEKRQDGRDQRSSQLQEAGTGTAKVLFADSPAAANVASETKAGVESTPSKKRGIDELDTGVADTALEVSAPAKKAKFSIENHLLAMANAIVPYYEELQNLSAPTKADLKNLDNRFKSYYDFQLDLVAPVPPGGKKHQHPYYQAVKDYVGGSTKINKALVKVTGCVDALEGGPLKETCQNLVAMLEKLPPCETVVYRAMGDLTERTQKYSVGYCEGLCEIGAIHREDGFASTSLLSFDQLRNMEKGIVFNAYLTRRCYMIIQSKSGRDIFCVSRGTAYKNEREVLFPPGTEFKVTRFDRKETGEYYFWMEEI